MEDFEAQKKARLEKNPFEEKRERLVKNMFLRKPLKEAFLAVKREAFFVPELKQHSYEDSAFPIGFGQTISQPTTIAIMLSMLDVKKGDKVLEVGSGSGYVAALLSELVGKEGRVFGIELVHPLHQRATRALLELGYENVQLKCGDGTQGWREEMPFDRILVSAACERIPKKLVEQLDEGGRIMVPVGGYFSQDLVLLEKKKGKAAVKERRCCFVFVPLKGRFS